MRMMLRITIPTESGTRALKDGSFHKAMQQTMERIKPEATYFVAHEGKRCAMLFFDMRDTSEIPGIAEPWFVALNAELELVPVMNQEDLQKGLASAM
ncbi:MAG TPA: hypothetical protein VMA37_11335 [Acetobacteraceae bacterium]|nr:hypothetical protein [Acetobacteraceae bacterium]